MATELAKAYVQIIPSAKGIKGMLGKTLDGEAESAGTSFGGKLTGMIKKVVATAAIGKALSASIKEGAALEQSLGGIETLFKNSADKVKQNAADAYRTAGISANEYMELTTSFAASLLSSLSNDTSKAADVADMAMTDMSDNANKMGSSMEDIKNAYQGFAKQNYTMLDNLKLGYGGTKTEMERLLADAEKITGVKYDIDNLSDVYSAIHVIQGELDITGTTAKEAATTISGSLDSMKAAFKNVLGEIALGMDIGPSLKALGETTTTFFVGNLLPALGNILAAVPELFTGITSMIVQNLNIASNNADKMVEQGAQIVGNLLMGIVTNLPYLAEAALKLTASFGSALINADWGEIGQGFISNLQSGLNLAAGEILGTDGTIIKAIGDAIQTYLPEILEKGVDIVTNIANGILQQIPGLIMMAGSLVTSFVDAILPALPMIMTAGTELVSNLASGIVNNLPEIRQSAVNAIAQFTVTVAQNLPQILQTGIEITGKLAAGLIRAVPTLIGQIPTIVSGIRNAFSGVDWGSIGRNIISGIATGLRNAGGQLWDAVKGILGSFKDNVLSFFGIHSPSRWGIYVGEMIDKGFAGGITGNLSLVTGAANKLWDVTSGPFSQDMSYTLRGSSSGGETSQGILERFDTLIGLMRMFIGSNKDVKIIANNREIIRYLKELGVAFV